MPVELREVLRVSDPTGRTYFLGTFSATDIKQLTFVPVVSLTRAEGLDPSLVLNEVDGGYQRAGDVGRMAKIRNFIVDRKDCLIPPVVLCARGSWQFIPGAGTENFGTVVANELAAIIDGQHRLGGLWQLAVDEGVDELIKKKPIPFMAIENMDIDAEKREFVDVNSTQKGVKKSLLVYLDKDTKFFGQAAWALSDDEGSVFKGRIDIQKKHDWVLFLFGAASECVELLYDQAFRSTKQFDPKVDESVRELAFEYLLQYWRTVSQAMPEYWSDFNLMPPVDRPRSTDRPGTRAFRYRLLEETGIRALSKLGSDIFRAAWIEGIRAPSWALVEQWLKRLAERERVRLVLTKPNLNPDVERLNPLLKSTGKAGVQTMYEYLNAEFMTVMQQGPGVGS